VGEGSAGSTVVAGSLHQIDAETLLPVGSTVALSHEVQDLAVSPDGGTAVVLYQADLMAAVDLATGRLAYEKHIGFGAVSAEISPDGHTVAVVCENGAVAVIEVETGNWVQEPWAARNNSATDVTYARDGDTFATPGVGSAVGLWDGDVGLPLGYVPSSAGDRRAAARFLPDGHTLLIASTDGGVVAWDNRIEHWIDHACNVAGRSLTADEWRDAFDDRPYRETCPTSR
jgi:WD40 repeat protein